MNFPEIPSRAWRASESTTPCCHPCSPQGETEAQGPEQPSKVAAVRLGVGSPGLSPWALTGRAFRPPWPLPLPPSPLCHSAPGAHPCLSVGLLHRVAQELRVACVLGRCPLQRSVAAPYVQQPDAAGGPRLLCRTQVSGVRRMAGFATRPSPKAPFPPLSLVWLPERLLWGWEVGLSGSLVRHPASRPRTCDQDVDGCPGLQVVQPHGEFVAA